MSLLFRLGLNRLFPRTLVRLARRLEGGDAQSLSLRRLLLEQTGTEVGAYSTGGLLQMTRARLDGLRVGRYVTSSDNVRWALPHPLDRIATSSALYDEAWGKGGTPPTPQSLDVEHDVWIDHNVVILGQCKRIGVGAIIKAGSIVTKDVPDFAIVAGVPAKIVGYRFEPALQEKILKSRWWDLSIDELARWQDAFTPQADLGAVDKALDEITLYRR